MDTQPANFTILWKLIREKKQRFASQWTTVISCVTPSPCRMYITNLTMSLVHFWSLLNNEMTQVIQTSPRGRQETVYSAPIAADDLGRQSARLCIYKQALYSASMPGIFRFQYQKGWKYSYFSNAISQELCSRFALCCRLLWFGIGQFYPYYKRLFQRHWHLSVPVIRYWWLWVNMDGLIYNTL